MAGLRYRVTGSDVYRYPGDPVITLDDVLSPSELCYKSFYICRFDHIYHSDISSYPNPLCTLIITAVEISEGASDRW